MVHKTLLAFDNEALTVANDTRHFDKGDPIINNSSTPNGTIFEYHGGLSQIVTVDDRSDSDVFNDDEAGSHTIVDAGALVPAGTAVESESLIVLRECSPDGTPMGPEIRINVYSRDGQTSNIWGFSATDELIPGKHYVKVSGSNNGDSLYAEFVPCFTNGTEILCEDGPRKVEDVTAGTMVWTAGGIFKPVRWAGVAHVPGRGDWAPIEFDPGVVGNQATLRVSPNHRMVVASPQSEILFGAESVLVAARFFLGQEGVRRVACETVDYHHFMFDDHEVVEANGALSESFFPGAVTLDGMDAGIRQELLDLFPDLPEICARMQPAIRVLRRFEAQALLAA